MTLIRGRERPHRKRTSKRSSFSLESIHNKTPVNLPAVKLPVTKYTEEDLQKIFRTVFETQAPSSDGSREKPLKARSPDVCCSKSHKECYNFSQQCEDHFAAAKAKGPNRISFAASFLRDRINFRWQKYKRKYKAKSTVPITWEEFKTFLCQSLGDFRAFVDSY